MSTRAAFSRTTTPLAPDMTIRILIILTAYVLSTGGFLFMTFGAMTTVFNESSVPQKLVPLTWMFAWTAHVRMSVAWARDLPVKRFWPVWGRIAGLFSLVSPVFLIALEGMSEFTRHLEAALVTSGVVSVYFSPSILLAVYLVRFHLRASAQIELALSV